MDMLFKLFSLLDKEFIEILEVSVILRYLSTIELYLIKMFFLQSV